MAEEKLVWSCKVCGSQNVQVYYVPKGDSFTTFVWCEDCGSCSDGKLVEKEVP